jgi:hypothetical protein
MKVSYGQGVASHAGPESCVEAREGFGEALTGECAGWVLSLVINNVRSADAVLMRGRQHRADRNERGPSGSAGSQASRMHRNTSQERVTSDSRSEAGRSQGQPRHVQPRPAT